MKIVPFIAALGFVALLGCSSAAALPVTPTPDIEAAIGARVSSTMATLGSTSDVSIVTGESPLLTERERVQEYLSDLYLVTGEFYRTIEGAGIRSDYSHSQQQFTLSGDADTALRITAGFVRRMRDIQPEGVPPELVVAHSILLSIAFKEQRWLDEYAEAGGENGGAESQNLLTQYANSLPLSDLHEADQLMRGVGFDHNLPIHSEGDLRVTLLHPDYMRYDEELSRVQAAVIRMMTDAALASVAASAAATSDFSAVDFDSTVAGTAFLFPNYLRENPTFFSYTWDTSGRVIQSP